MAFLLPICDDISERLEEKTTLSFTRQGRSVAIFPEYKWDPVGFCRDILGVELWIAQQEVAQLVATHPRVSVAACYASGKTFLAACLVLWWLFTRKSCLVVTTAPTGRQVKELLWAEIGMLHSMSKVPLGGKILTRETRLGKHRRGFGVAGDGKSTNAGYHDKSGQVLFIVDEKAGMKRQALADFDGLMVDENECRELGIGNPVSTSGPFYEEHMNPDEMSRWKLYSISALRTPNLTGNAEDKKRYPGLVSASWVEHRRKKWGEKHPLFITKVLGQFYIVAGLAKVVPNDWVAVSQKRWSGILEGLDSVDVLGIDVAGGGQNQTVAYRRKGRRLFRAAAWHEPDTMITARRIVELGEKLQVKRICIDTTGLGIGIGDRVHQLKAEGRLSGIEVYSCNLGAGAEEDGYVRLVDQVQFAMRQAFDPENPLAVAIDPQDTDLAEELPHRGWSIVEDGGNIKVERKRDLKARGIDSPDSADAASLTFYEPPNAGEFFFV